MKKVFLGLMILVFVGVVCVPCGKAETLVPLADLIQIQGRLIGDNGGIENEEITSIVFYDAQNAVVATIISPSKNVITQKDGFFNAKITISDLISQANGKIPESFGVVTANKGTFGKYSISTTMYSLGSNLANDSATSRKLEGKSLRQVIDQATIEAAAFSKVSAPLNIVSTETYAILGWSGKGIGVTGISSNTKSFGVYGIATAEGGAAIGGLNANTTAQGLGAGSGVWGITFAPAPGAGVYGSSTASSNGVGVYGSVNSPMGYGVGGYNGSSGGYGVNAYGGGGVRATATSIGNYAGYFSGGRGVYVNGSLEASGETFLYSNLGVRGKVAIGKDAPSVQLDVVGADEELPAISGYNDRGTGVQGRGFYAGVAGATDIDAADTHYISHRTGIFGGSTDGNYGGMFKSNKTALYVTGGDASTAAAILENPNNGIALKIKGGLSMVKNAAALSAGVVDATTKSYRAVTDDWTRVITSVDSKAMNFLEIANTNVKAGDMVFVSHNGLCSMSVIPSDGKINMTFKGEATPTEVKYLLVKLVANS